MPRAGDTASNHASRPTRLFIANIPFTNIVVYSGCSNILLGPNFRFGGFNPYDSE
jgi:hypothetical protein